MHILALIDAIHISGPGRQLVASAIGLRHRGVTVTIGLFERAGSSPRPFAQFVRQHDIPVVVFHERRALDLSVVDEVERAVKHLDPDVIQSHGYKPSAVCWTLRRRGLQLPWVAFFHGATTENLKVRAYHALDQWLMRWADAVVLMSKLHERKLAGRFSNARVIHNAVLFPPSPEFFERIDLPEPPRILVIGRLSSEKGVDVLLRASVLLNDRGRSIALTVVGDGPDRSTLERLAKTLRLEHVEFIGHVSDPTAHYQSADLLVIPSRSEGLPNVLLEAISHGLPVVATTVGAIPEVITDPRLGRLCPPENAKALADAIQASLTDDFRYGGVSAREQILREFSVDHRAARLHDLYQDLVALRAPVLPASRSERSH